MRDWFHPESAVKCLILSDSSQYEDIGEKCGFDRTAREQEASLRIRLSGPVLVDGEPERLREVGEAVGLDGHPGESVLAVVGHHRVG